MKCILLAAGYATRMYPLTENFPKPLLEIQGKPLLDWLIGDIDNIKEIEEINIVTNHKFIDIFKKWYQKNNYNTRINILDDGSTQNENRIGALRDVALCVDRLKINDDILVLAGDNLVDFSFDSFVDFFKNIGHTCIMTHYEESVEKLRKTGVVELDDVNRVLQMQEKPQNPISNYAVPPFYIYAKKDLEIILDGINNGKCNVDSPGSLIKWLCEKTDIYAYHMKGKRYDVGSLETYYKLKENFIGK